MVFYVGQLPNLKTYKWTNIPCNNQLLRDMAPGGSKISFEYPAYELCVLEDSRVETVRILERDIIRGLVLADYSLEGFTMQKGFPVTFQPGQSDLEAYSLA